jgi:hypothetical protein
MGVGWLPHAEYLASCPGVLHAHMQPLALAPRLAHTAAAGAPSPPAGRHVELAKAMLQAAPGLSWHVCACCLTAASSAVHRPGCTQRTLGCAACASTAMQQLLVQRQRQSIVLSTQRFSIVPEPRHASPYVYLFHHLWQEGSWDACL